MVRKRAWILNLEADEELARPAGYTPKAAAVARARALAARLAALLGPEDVLVWPDDPAAMTPAAAPDGDREGRAWCPTPRALRALRRAGAEPAPAPPLAVLRRVNHRRFCAELGQPLPGARFVETLAELAETIAGPSPTGQWILKRPFAFSGRGRMRVAQGALDPSALPWINASLSSGEASPGLQVEPWVERCGDFSVHGHLTPAGALVLGAPCAQRCDERGAWLETRRAAPGELTPAEARALLEAARAAAEALTAAGYFGPFGVDAFRWRGADGRACFNPRCEINARYTMGWAIGMGPSRPDLGYAGPTR